MSAANAGPVTVAIVGGGPRGLYCLERLLSEAAVSGRELRVDVYEPSGEFGPGAVYATTQPEYLRMNFADALVNAWTDGPTVVADELRCTFTEWCEREGFADPSGYSSRAVVGGYLRACFEAVADAAPDGAEVVRRDRAVTAIERDGEGWLLRSVEQEHRYDHVMLTTGHRPPPPPGPDDPPRVDYPLLHSLERRGFPPGGDVVVRGMALTFIDVALELTEGRGGRFIGDPGGREPLLYEASGAEPGQITGRSRTGRPMLVKPEPGAVLGPDAVAAIAGPGREGLAALGEERFEKQLQALVARTAEQLLAAAGGEPDGDPAALLEGLLEPAGADPGAPAASVTRSWEIACGRRPPDAAWALGESWRCLYPALVERGSHGGVPDEEWPRFALLAREMERLAFGPPPVNGAKLLALIEAGIVRLERGGREDGEISLDAVLPAPGAVEECGDLVDLLLERGLIRRAGGGRRGIEIGPDGGCVDAEGGPGRGLAAVGRLSEDWVIGNDTLNRSLHPHPGRWAREVAGL